jgi:hypothetical protein
MTINVAHPPLSGERAEQLLDEALRNVRSSSALRILKIIHGYGSTGKGGTLRTVVRNWCHTRGAQLRAVLPGEDVSPFDERARSIAAACGISVTDELGPANDGMTIVWVS